MDLRQRIKKLFFPVVAVVAVVFAGYFYVQLHRLQQNPQAVAQQEVTDLVAKVSRLMVLPVGETPTVATVSDPTALKDQPFFANAKNGDKVLIYTNAKKAILYSVALDKIVEVAPLNIGQANNTPTTPPSNTAPTTPAPTKSDTKTQ